MTATTEAETTTMPGATPKLNKALSQLQGELPRVTKTKTGKVEGENKAGKYFSYEYSYADLGDVVHDVGPLLAKHGLAFHCAPTINPAERREMILLWSLLHESGEERTGEWPLGPVNQKPQSLGSAITYGRRYCFTAATNIVLEDDDDGQRAQQDHGSRQTAGAAWENATPAKPRQIRPDDAAPAEHDTPDDEQTWYQTALPKAHGFKTEPEGFTLLREADDARSNGRCTTKQHDHIQNIIIKRIKDRRKVVAARILEPVPDDDSWRIKILEELASDDDARADIEEIGRLKAAGTMAEDRATLLARAIIARFPKAAIRDQEAA